MEKQEKNTHPVNKGLCKIGTISHGFVRLPDVDLHALSIYICM